MTGLVGASTPANELEHPGSSTAEREPFPCLHSPCHVIPSIHPDYWQSIDAKKPEE